MTITREAFFDAVTRLEAEGRATIDSDGRGFNRIAMRAFKTGGVVTRVPDGRLYGPSGEVDIAEAAVILGIPA